MKKHVIVLNEAKVRKIVEESLRSLFGLGDSEKDNSDKKELAADVISEFEDICNKCNMKIQFTLGGEYFGAVCEKSFPDASDGDIDRLVKLVRASWIRQYLDFDGIQYGSSKDAVKYRINFDDGGYLSDRYHEQMMGDLHSMQGGFVEKYQI